MPIILECILRLCRNFGFEVSITGEREMTITDDEDGGKLKKTRRLHSAER